jgi:hypothetical protein
MSQGEGRFFFPEQPWASKLLSPWGPLVPATGWRRGGSASHLALEDDTWGYSPHSPWPPSLPPRKLEGICKACLCLYSGLLGQGLLGAEAVWASQLSSWQWAKCWQGHASVLKAPWGDPYLLAFQSSPSTSAHSLARDLFTVSCWYRKGSLLEGARAAAAFFTGKKWLSSKNPGAPGAWTCRVVGGKQGAMLQGSKLVSPREVCWEVMKTEQNLADFRLSWEQVCVGRLSEATGYTLIHYLPQPRFMWKGRGRLAAPVSSELEKEGCTMKSKTRCVSWALPIHSDSSGELSAYIQVNSSRTAESQSVTKKTISLNTLHVGWFSGALSSWALVKTYRAGLSVCMGLCLRYRAIKGWPSLSASALWRRLKSSAALGVVAHAFNPSTREAEAGGSLSSRPAWSTKWVPGQPGLHRETLSREKKKRVAQLPTLKEQTAHPCLALVTPEEHRTSHLSTELCTCYSSLPQGAGGPCVVWGRGGSAEERSQVERLARKEEG